MSEHPENYEDVSVYGLDADDEAAMLTAQNECTFIWSNKEGWPVGVIMSYVHRDGKFWLTASSQRARISAVRRDPRVCIVVTSTGSGLPRNKTVTYKGTCTVRDDDETKAWFYPALAKKVSPENTDFETYFNNLLDSPLRTIVAITPVKKIMYNSGTAGRHMAGTISEEELGERLESDRVRMNKYRAERGLPER